jgi:hypothetical protein
MICIICNVRGVDNGYIGASNFKRNSVTCYECRDETYPKHMQSKQYQRYWNAFHELYLERSTDGNEKSNEEVTSRTSD